MSAPHYRAATAAYCDGAQLNEALRLMAAMKTAGAAPDDDNELVNVAPSNPVVVFAAISLTGTRRT